MWPRPGDLLVAAALHAPVLVRERLQAAADAFEQAGRAARVRARACSVMASVSAAASSCAAPRAMTSA
ncbi:hypothetical protein AB0C86_36290 [Streptomyces lavendulae]|uniref:hypothetical protein n=1 Tax=Streptomyces lavendulae TaxID=1914 RepID=UPI0033ED34E5